MGQGMGGGGGRGMGRGMSMPGVRGSNMEDHDNLSKEQGMEVLRKQAAHLKRKMEEIEARIRKLE